MTTLEPAWRVKSRPCPFYQRGCCIFAESCNFMHTISVKQMDSGGTFLEFQSPKSPEYVQFSTPPSPPIVTIDSPRSIRSPPRSPRMAGLLLALKDVIGDEPADEEEGEIYTDSVTLVSDGPESATWSAGLQTLVHGADTTFFAQVTETMAEMMRVTEDDHNDEPYSFSDSFFNDPTPTTPNISDRLDASGSTLKSEQLVEPSGDDHTLCMLSSSLHPSHDTPSIHASQSSPEQEQILEMPRIPENHNDLLSPVDLSYIHLHTFAAQGNTSGAGKDASSTDSETVNLPPPLVKSPPRSPAMSSTFELLHSPFGTPSARVLSPRLSAFIGRSPASLLKPLASNQDEIPELDLSLDLPSDIRPNILDPYEYEGPQTVRASNQLLDSEADISEAVDSQDPQELSFSSDEGELEAGGDDNDTDKEEHETYGHTSIWDAEGEPTAVYVGNKSPLVKEVRDEIERQCSTPLLLPSTDSDLPWQDADLQSSMDLEPTVPPSDLKSAFEDDSFDEEDSEDDSTAFLDYLQSDTQEGDTLNSLYDVYSALALPPKELTPTPSSSTPSSLRERVFTPPPQGRSRSGTVTADSPMSLSSPITSLDSLSRGRCSPLSAVSDNKLPAPKNEQHNVESSRKVPFGFRQSLTLGRTSRSSLTANRNRSLSRLSVSNLDDQQDPSPPASTSASSASPTTGSLRPLRLSTLLHAKSHTRSSIISSNLCPVNVNSYRLSQNLRRESMSSIHVSSSNSSNPPLSSAWPSFIPSHLRNTLLESQQRSPSLLTDDLNHLATFDSPLTAPITFPPSWPSDHLTSHYDHLRSSSRLSEPIHEQDGEDDNTHRHDVRDETIRRVLPTPPPHTAPVTRSASVLQQPMYAIATPRPTLMFAIASDDVDQVRQVLENGDASPNDAVGPQSALAFALTNDQLTHKLDIVKVLLAFGADPSALKEPGLFTRRRGSDMEEGRSSEAEPHQMSKSLMEEMDPATKYYVERADAAHTRRTSSLIHRSFFRPLTRVRYEVIGQDRALEELFRLLNIHSRQLSVAPVVVMLCGPSGHGKSLLARKFGSLLDVPAHTVNMVTLRSQDDLWESYSMSPYDEPTNCTLAEFLINNEGKRCIVVLDEIEKVENAKVLSSLLMPWEHGRCSFEAKSRYVDVRNVIWLCTSNIGHDLVFKQGDMRQNTQEMLTREEYLELMALLRPQVSERLGASVLSRVTSVLPFVPFTLEEQRAICAEAIYQLGREDALTLSSQAVESLIESALKHYIPEEGARSLYRAVSNQLVDVI